MTTKRVFRPGIERRLAATAFSARGSAPANCDRRWEAPPSRGGGNAAAVNGWRWPRWLRPLRSAAAAVGTPATRPPSFETRTSAPPAYTVRVWSYARVRSNRHSHTYKRAYVRMYVPHTRDRGYWLVFSCCLSVCVHGVNFWTLTPILVVVAIMVVRTDIEQNVQSSNGGPMFRLQCL